MAEKTSIRLIPYTPNCAERGFTILELLVAAFLGLLVMALALSTTLVSRNVLGKDTIRVQLAQNLRGGLDIIGTDIRIGGENLGPGFPAIEVTDGTAGAPDTLYVRRNLADEVLPVCVSIAAGSGVGQVVFANSPTVTGCVYAGHTHDYTAWRTKRLAAPGGKLDAYIFDTVSKKGEFFRYNGEADTGTTYYITRTAGNFTNAYPATSSSVYLLEEWKYQVQNGVLQVIQNNDTANALNVIFNVTNFQIQALMQDGTVKTSFARTDAWTQISEMQVDLTGSERYARNNITRMLTGKFFPRNVLSN